MLDLTSHTRSAQTRRDPLAGVTLIEMMVVLVMISVVAALIVPNVIGRPDEARVSVAATDMRSIAGALQLYRLDNGTYPTTAQGLDALAVRPVTPPLPRTWPVDGYLTVVPLDPWGTPYVYRAEGGRFDLISLGADAAIGGEGVNADIPLRDAQARAGL
ncbi:type II secretion system major pseudopilin GspG [Tateyamaria sp. syn59]|uniref:type II secretion system major pseudopilin GspG n=1 Tax=Tateyamaria sp. syn59 TaxID=2576942 RepID=UPI0011BED278|nr:type II secretion system major pseudopilin GspG [Tateyamaria sp. syn59]